MTRRAIGLIRKVHTYGDANQGRRAARQHRQHHGATAHLIDDKHGNGRTNRIHQCKRYVEQNSDLVFIIAIEFNARLLDYGRAIVHYSVYAGQLLEELQHAANK